MWAVDYSAAAERDIELVFDHLFATYCDLGDDPADAIERAAERVRGIRSSIDRLGEAPFIGTLRDDIHPGLRFVRRDQAAVWFLPVENRKRILVAAIFFGPQDHIRHMLARLLSE
ncbi:type II toxin-antitoxin system RelE/ParE family toxin [Roseibium salinum]|uniref:Type II toxin-antitoxin system RelE/ParE family toxin n=1 Tax=Roseibium salinum TaxID=1604349 RepID=A0ABT3QWK9_9HYPH|nr:type II toxin-antitoxin system RelE/ParE family toxin [Roseibium sp. DSM 29163]MCX2721324.1 type II toxin-antitoxin system RelE/ParE family toxin [Roseibium sp. DSM 29163]